MQTILEQRENHNKMINRINGDLTYLPDWHEKSIFLMYVKEQLELHGVEYYYQNYHKQLFNLYLKDLSKSFMKQTEREWVVENIPEWLI